jgi:hypothetical protein
MEKSRGKNMWGWGWGFSNLLKVNQMRVEVRHLFFEASWGNREPGRVSTLFGFSSYPKYKNAAEKVFVTALCSIC